MFSVHITGHAGIRAEFVVPSPVVALDMVLRAARAGFTWRATSDAGDPAPVSLPGLHELARRRASDVPAEARYLDEVISADSRGVAATAN